MEELLTPEEVAGRLRLSRRTIIGWLQDGRIAGLKVGNRWRIRADQVDSLVTGPFAHEDQQWLDAEMAGELPPYDWGEAGEPPLVPVTISADGSLIIVEPDTGG